MSEQDEPKRMLCDEDADPVSRHLFALAKADGPSQRALAAAPAAIGALLAARAAAAGSAAVTQAISATRVGSFSAGLMLKWLAIGALVGVTSSLAAVLASDAPAEHSKVAAERSVPAPPPTSRTALALPVVERGGLAASASAAPPVIQSSVPAAPNPLARELALLDAARLALSAANPTAALGYLDSAERLPMRSLAPEATVLRVRALLELGRREEAASVANQFARRSPASPQVRVLRELVGWGFR